MIIVLALRNLIFMAIAFMILSSLEANLIAFSNFELGRIDWETHDNESEIIFKPKNSPHQSKVEFAFDSRSGSPLRRIYSDFEAADLAAPPGQTLWYAHPETIVNAQRLSLEKYFLELISELGFKGRVPNLVQNSASFQWELEEFEDLLESFTRDPNSSVAFSSFTESLKKSVALSRLTLVYPRLPTRLRESLESPFLLFALGLPRLPTFLYHINQSEWLSRFDIVEAAWLDGSHNENYYDAFVLYPIQQMQARGYEQLALAIHSYINSSQPFPLDWFRNESRVPLALKLVVLILLTHNHQSENALIKAVALKYGLVKSYQIASLINQAYRREESSWNQNQRAHRTQDHYEIHSKGIPFLDARQKWEIDISFFANTPQWIPYHQRYHFYGAFTVAARLDRHLPPLMPRLSHSKLRRIVIYLGQTYKRSTTSSDAQQTAEQLDKMKIFYSAGVDAYLKFKMEHE